VTYVAEPMHEDCVACHDRPSGETPTEVTMVLLIMMSREGLTVADLKDGLCFYHRRMLEDCVAAPEPGKVG
jgi:hypothetical protein